MINCDLKYKMKTDFGSDHQKVMRYTETPPLMEKMPDEDGCISALLKDLIISEDNKVACSTPL